MRRVLKMRLSPWLPTTIETADPPCFLSVDWQGDDLVVWFEATVGVVETARLTVVTTGGYVPDHHAYIGTAQHPTMLNGGPFVAHVYRQVEP